jgi:hypothetical protein
MGSVLVEVCCWNEATELILSSMLHNERGRCLHQQATCAMRMGATRYGSAAIVELACSAPPHIWLHGMEPAKRRCRQGPRQRWARLSVDRTSLYCSSHMREHGMELAGWAHNEQQS